MSWLTLVAVACRRRAYAGGGRLRQSEDAKPIWSCPDVKFVAKFAQFVPLERLRDDDKLTGILLTSGKASRLSVQPLSKPHFDRIVTLGSGKSRRTT